MTKCRQQEVICIIAVLWFKLLKESRENLLLEYIRTAVHQEANPATEVGFPRVGHHLKIPSAGVVLTAAQAVRLDESSKSSYWHNPGAPRT